MKLTNGLGKVLVLVAVLSATACVGAYDSSYDPATPAYGGEVYVAPTHVEPQPEPVHADYCGVVSGYSVPGNDVAIYDDATCGGAPLATTVADSSGFFEVSVCASGPAVNARSFDEWGQGSTCSSDMWVADPNASAW